MSVVLIRFPFALFSGRISFPDFSIEFFHLILLRPANGSSVDRPHPSQFSVAFALNRPTMGNLFIFFFEIFHWIGNRWNHFRFMLNQLIYIFVVRRALGEFIFEKKCNFKLAPEHRPRWIFIGHYWPVRALLSIIHRRLRPNACYAYSLTRVVNMTQVRGWGHGRRWIRRGTWRSGCSGEGLRRSGHGGFGFRWRHWWSILKYYFGKPLRWCSLHFRPPFHYFLPILLCRLCHCFDLD